MKKSIVNLSVVAVVLMSMLASVVLAGAYSRGTKKFVLRPGTSGYTEVEWSVVKNVKVRARADQGSVQIKVVNGKGRTVARGKNKVSFKTGNGKNKYKIIVANKTKKVQKVELSYTASDDLW